jgi:hypothetical protein
VRDVEEEAPLHLRHLNHDFGPVFLQHLDEPNGSRGYHQRVRKLSQDVVEQVQLVLRLAVDRPPLGEEIDCGVETVMKKTTSVKPFAHTEIKRNVPPADRLEEADGVQSPEVRDGQRHEYRDVDQRVDAVVHDVREARHRGQQQRPSRRAKREDGHEL